MRKLTFLGICVIIFQLQSCCPILEDCNDDDFITLAPRYEPVIINRTDFEQSVALKDPIPISTSGKIYIKGDLLFINEVRKGFHVFDNSDPSSPAPIKFLEAPGSSDLAIRDNMVYINQATDLIAVEYDQAMNQITLTKRVINVFPELRSPEGFLPTNIPENGVVVNWKRNN